VGVPVLQTPPPNLKNKPVPVWFWVAVGGALGSVARYGAGQLLSHFWGEGLPWGTFMVNAVGSLLAGLIWAWCVRGGSIDAALNKQFYAFSIIGFCGGFTTFSAFSREVFVLAQAGQHNQALLYILMSLGIGVLCFWLGFRLMNV